MAIIKNRCYDNIPIIICKTCGKMAKREQVIELEDPALISVKRYKRKKTWARLIKSSFNISYDGRRKKRNKRIFYSAFLQTCINKKHKLLVKHLNGIKFHSNCLDIMKEDKDEDD